MRVTKRSKGKLSEDELERLRKSVESEFVRTDETPLGTEIPSTLAHSRCYGCEIRSNEGYMHRPFYPQCPKWREVEPQLGVV